MDSTLQLVKRGREKYDDLNKQLFSMVELYLLLREKIAIAVEDDEIFSLVHNKWNLQGFVQELIQALMPLREFGGYLHKYSKEIMVNHHNSCFTTFCVYDPYLTFNCTLM